jgi:hypothetical protein
MIRAAINTAAWKGDIFGTGLVNNFVKWFFG